MHLNLRHIFLLGLKELKSFFSDIVLLIFVIYAFTLQIVIAANGSTMEVRNAAVAVVDEDGSTLSRRLPDLFRQPTFQQADHLANDQIDTAMDEGRYTFVLVIPPGFQADLQAGRKPQMQLLVDATAVTTAYIGAGYIQRIVSGEIVRFLADDDTPEAAPPSTPMQLSEQAGVFSPSIRVRYNPNREEKWFMGITETLIIVTMLSILLPGAALLREREHGTIEHLLVMPLRPVEIMLGKVWPNALIVLLGTFVTYYIVLQEVLDIPVSGADWLFFLGTAVFLFTTTSLGVLLSTVSKNVPHQATLTILVMMPLVFLSGAYTPVESMPDAMKSIMFASPLKFYISFCASLMFKGAGLDTLWDELAIMALIGLVFFTAAGLRFRSHFSLANQ